MPPKATEDPAASRHKRADHRGSTKKVHKTFYLDCCTYLDEIPRSKHKETNDLVEAVKKSAWSVQNLAKRVTEPVEMTQRQAATATRHAAVMNRDLEGVEGRTAIWKV